MIALLENHYDADTNTVKLPEALRPYAPLFDSEEGF
jgi:seryl-tRNA synthetase